ncbi:MAG: hypothetical protein C0394_08315 [Syntrophus sp. (in: bacteria)]|nr:hypothetical protein [Syntrophus sp. (in: bacteria)]
MTREELLATAEKLPRFSTVTAGEFAEKREQLAAEMNRIMGQRPDLADLIGQGNREMMEDNHRNHARFIGSLIQNFSPQVLVETVLWVFRAYRSHGFRLTYWPAQLDTWVEVLKRELSPGAYEEIYPLYHWMIIHQPAFVGLSDALIGEQATPGHGA